MTFIGIRCTSNFAEIVADTASYLDRGTAFAECSKVDTYPHLDAAFTCSGHGRFSDWAHLSVRVAASTHVTCFDELIQTAPLLLDRALEMSKEDPDEPSGDQASAVAFFVGYSQQESGYAAFSATMQDRQPKRIDGFHVQPTPLSKRPTQQDIDWLREAAALDENVSAEDVASLIDAWSAKPPPAVNSASDWIKLAQAARTTRSLSGDDFMRIWVAGSLYITRMKRGSIRTNKLLTFNDTGDELRKLLADSRHPVAQISPCGACASGKPAIDCCLQDEFDEPCGCLSGKTFGGCCVVSDRDAVPDRLWTT